MTTLRLSPLTPSKSAIARMAVSADLEAADWLWMGKPDRAEGRFRAADKFWEAALDHIGTDGAQWDRRTVR